MPEFRQWRVPRPGNWGGERFASRCVSACVSAVVGDCPRERSVGGVLRRAGDGFVTDAVAHHRQFGAGRAHSHDDRIRTCGLREFGSDSDRRLWSVCPRHGLRTSLGCAPIERHDPPYVDGSIDVVSRFCILRYRESGTRDCGQSPDRIVSRGNRGPVPRPVQGSHPLQLARRSPRTRGARLQLHSQLRLRRADDPRAGEGRFLLSHGPVGRRLPTRVPDQSPRVPEFQRSNSDGQGSVHNAEREIDPSELVALRRRSPGRFRPHRVGRSLLHRRRESRGQGRPELRSQCVDSQERAREHVPLPRRDVPPHLSDDEHGLVRARPRVRGRSELAAHRFHARRVLGRAVLPAPRPR